MVMWKTIQINKQNLKVDTGKAILIQMPHKSMYDGYSFWYSSKLVREGLHSYSLALNYKNEYVIRLIKYGKGKYNKYCVLDEKEINIEEFEEAFGVMNENIIGSKKDNESYLIVEEPKKIEKEIKVEECLKNN